MEMERDLREWEHNPVKMAEGFSEGRHLKHFSLSLYPFWKSELILFTWEAITLARADGFCRVCFVLFCFLLHQEADRTSLTCTLDSKATES